MPAPSLSNPAATPNGDSNSSPSARTAQRRVGAGEAVHEPADAPAAAISRMTRNASRCARSGSMRRENEAEEVRDTCRRPGYRLRADDSAMPVRLRRPRSPAVRVVDLAAGVIAVSKSSSESNAW